MFQLVGSPYDLKRTPPRSCTRRTYRVHTRHARVIGPSLSIEWCRFIHGAFVILSVVDFIMMTSFLRCFGTWARRQGLAPISPNDLLLVMTTESAVFASALLLHVASRIRSTTTLSSGAGRCSRLVYGVDESSCFVIETYHGIKKKWNTEKSKNQVDDVLDYGNASESSGWLV